MNLFGHPDFTVLFDFLAEHGHVRHVDVWTDDEAETCRLVAFAVAQRGLKGDVMKRDGLLPDGAWEWFRRRNRFSIERMFSAFDVDDFALAAPLNTGHFGRKLYDLRRKGRYATTPLPVSRLEREEATP